MSEEAATVATGHRRVRAGLRKPGNWLQLLRFGLVGASGYVVNLVVFAGCVTGAGFGHRPAAVLAFGIALANNFAWNRRWTFAARDRPGGRAHVQAARFFVVSLAAFACSFALLELLVAGLGFDAVAAQAIAIATATPLNFVGNKLWTFDR